MQNRRDDAVPEGRAAQEEEAEGADMTLRQVAVTCVHEGRLRTLCSVILRHMGYEVWEAADVTEAKRLMEAESAAVLIAGRDEAENAELKNFCAGGRLKYIFVAPEERIEALLDLLEQRATPRQI